MNNKYNFKIEKGVFIIEDLNNIILNKMEPSFDWQITSFEVVNNTINLIFTFIPDQMVTFEKSYLFENNKLTLLVVMMDNIIDNLINKNNIDFVKKYFKNEYIYKGIEILQAIIVENNNDKNNFYQSLIGLGMCGLGACMLLVAIFDPEPISKLNTLILGATLLLSQGSIAILVAMGQNWKVEFNKLIPVGK